MSSAGEFFAELQRRHVVRAAIAHVVVAWLLIQFADVVLPYIGIVDEPVRWAFVISVATFPITLIVAWFFEHPWHKYTGSRLAFDVIVIVAVGTLAATWAVRNIPDVVRIKTSIAVLPFAHSGDSLEQSVSRAIAYEVNSLLMKSKSIDVIGFESVTSPLLAGLGTMAVADRLRVQHVLSGEVSVLDNLMRIDLRLLDSAGVVLWDAVIEDSIDNLFSVQERIAVAIESRLGAGDNTVPVATVAANRCWMPNDPSALERYYTARYYTELRTDTEASQQQLADAVELYRELIDEHPDFAVAHSGLAWALLYQGTYDPERALPENERRAEADRLAAIALNRCSTLGEAMHLLPNQFDHENGWIGDHQQLTAFIEMQPETTENYQRLARHYRETGHIQRSLDVAEQNYRLNPLSVRSIKELAFALMQVERMEEAVEMFDVATDLGSTGENFARTNAPMLECNNDVECLLENLPPYFEPFSDQFAVIYRKPANSAEAEESIEAAMALFYATGGELLNLFNGTSCQFQHLVPVFFMVWEANKELNKYWYWPNAWNPSCASVWSHPKFPAFAEEVGYIEYWQEVGFPPGFGMTEDGELLRYIEP